MPTRPIALTLILLVIVASSLACDASSDTAPPLSTDTPLPTYTPSKAFELGLPFTAEQHPLRMIPLGETINHDPPKGHPGIDFSWPYKAEIIVAVDGIVGDVQGDVKHVDVDGAIIYNLTIVSGKYGVVYHLIDLYVLNPDLTIGDYVESGRVLGYSRMAAKDDAWTDTQIHWALGIVSESSGRPNPEGVIERYSFDWLCPIPYLLASERERLLLVWKEAGYQHKDKFPEICNGYYKGDGPAATPPRRH